MENQNRQGSIKIVVESVRVEGTGAILLTGPSSCGKGEIAKSLCQFLSIPTDMHLSMGDILRQTIRRARQDAAFRQNLATEHDISDQVSIFTPGANHPEVIEKVGRYQADVAATLGIDPRGITQLDWLEYCVRKGLLIPDEWTERLIDALVFASERLRNGIFILDGYPRTPLAAQKLLRTFDKANIPVIKILHLSITKEQMKRRALNRRRQDDTEAILESRYQFYIEKVQPCIDYLKAELSPQTVALIDAHQPVFAADGQFDLKQSIGAVTLSVIQALGLPPFLLELN